MKILGPAECADWCRRNNVRLDGESCEPLLPEGDDLLSFGLPRESGLQLSLSRQIVEWLGDYGSALTWCTDWPMRLDDEAALVATWRRAHGETRELFEAPGHLMAAAERADLANLLFFHMAFGWEGFVITAGGRDLVRISHDEYVNLFTRDRGRFDRVRDLLKLLNLKVVRL